MIFAPICPARAPPCERNGLPDAMSGVCVNWEKPLTSGLVFVGNAGIGLKLGWFNRLKTSKRSWRLIRSVSLVFLITLKSHCLNPGPRNAFRPQLPMVLLAGIENMAGTFVIVGILGSLN